VGRENIEARSIEEDEDRMIIDHTHPIYRRIRAMSGANKHNGAYYYSKEICERIIPNVVTDYNWMTINVPGTGCDHMIVFIHNNKNPQYYEWLSKFKDLVLVCGVPETVPKMEYLGRAIYLPLSINVEEVEGYRTEKTKDTAFAGRASKHRDIKLPVNTDYIQGMPRERLLEKMAQYKKIYAVGRTAIEAKALGCEILPYDPRFPDVDRWKVIDNLEAAKMLQEELDK
jgi:hypothetical protein